MDLSPSPLLAQIPQYIAWKPDHKVRSNQYVHSFLPFSIIKKFLRKIAQDQVRRILIVLPYGSLKYGTQHFRECQ